MSVCMYWLLYKTSVFCTIWVGAFDVQKGCVLACTQLHLHHCELVIIQRIQQVHQLLIHNCKDCTQALFRFAFRVIRLYLCAISVWKFHVNAYSPAKWLRQTVQRLSRAEPRGRAREWATLGVQPLSWLLSNNRLEEVSSTLTKGTFSSRLLLSNQDKRCTPSVAHSLLLPLPPSFCSTCQVITGSRYCCYAAVLYWFCVVISLIVVQDR